MTAILKGCCALKYCCQATGMVANDVVGRENGNVIANGALRDHVTQVATAMGIRKPISLVEKEPLRELPFPIQDANEYIAMARGFSSFGNTILPIKAGVNYNAGHGLDENTVKYLLTKQIAMLNTNGSLIGNIVSLVVAIATTILLAPVMPIASYFIGAFAGTLANLLIYKLSERRSERMAMQYSAPAVRQAAIAAFERLRDQVPAGAMRNDVMARLDRMRSYLNLPALPAARA